MGIERCDIPYQLARQLARANRSATILVLDNSKTKDMFGPMTGWSDLKYATLDNITVMKDKLPVEETYERYDYIIIYYGMNKNKDENILHKSDYVFLMTDYSPITVSEIIKSGIPDRNDMIVIFRDKALKKISEKFITDKLEITPKDVYVLELDLKDTGLYLSFLHNGFQRLLDESGGMITLMTDMVAEIASLPYKKAKKVIEK